MDLSNEGFHGRKKDRKEYYFKFVHGVKRHICGACNGSGRYDNNGSPKCGACEGEGKVFCKTPYFYDGKSYG